MSEWQQNDEQRVEGWIRGYERGVLLGNVGRQRDSQGPWTWHLFDETSAEVGPCGVRDTAWEAQEACDAAAVAWVLILLAKRAALWADKVDAQLAREYRNADFDLQQIACSRSREAELPAARERLEKAYYALMGVSP